MNRRVVFAFIAITVPGVDTGLLTGRWSSSPIYAQVNWFPSPSPKLDKPRKQSHSVARNARVLFFISSDCGRCPEEAAKLETELTRLGVKYQIEGIFVGGPAQAGRYIAGLRAYPFKFELGLDMNGSIAKQYGVNAFPTAVIELADKRLIVRRASELPEKL